MFSHQLVPTTPTLIMVPAWPSITDSLVQYGFQHGVVLGDDYVEQVQNVDKIDMVPLSHGPRPRVRQSNVQAMCSPVLNTLCKRRSWKSEYDFGGVESW